jgi:type III secretory pathway component EscR
MDKKLQQPPENTLKCLALVMAVNCVRNTIIEDYHARGKLDEREMEAFNKEVASKLYTFLKFLFGAPSPERDQFLHNAEKQYPYDWDEPQSDDDSMLGLKISMSSDEKK